MRRSLVVPVASLAVVACGCGKINAGASPQGLVTTVPASTTATTPSSTKVPPPSASLTPVPTGTTAVTSSSPLCTNGQMVVSDSGGGAGLGHEDQVILFTNDSPAPCTLTGYPGVAGLNASGQQVVQAIRTPSGYLGGLWNNATTPPRVSLNPGQTASAIVEGTDNPIGTATSCPSYTHLLVTPPNLTNSVRVSVSGLGSPPTSGLPGCSVIEVHPVVPGSIGTVQ
jgi:hypothetical protein